MHIGGLIITKKSLVVTNEAFRTNAPAFAPGVPAQDYLCIWSALTVPKPDPRGGGD
ncbi:hypothetical protein OCAR_5050 [Afipia carboxidovorans OM5]|nr:hypothetical protein OCAR_5050 [Afipia carboxidovorans OM5]